MEEEQADVMSFSSLRLKYVFSYHALLCHHKIYILTT